MQSEIARVIPVICADGGGILQQEIFILLLVVHLVEIEQVLHKNTLELHGVIIAAFGWPAAFLIQYAAAVSIGHNIGIGNHLGFSQIGCDGGDLVQVGQATKNDALVICPGILAIILTCVAV